MKGLIVWGVLGAFGIDAPEFRQEVLMEARVNVPRRFLVKSSDNEVGGQSYIYAQQSRNHVGNSLDSAKSARNAWSEGRFPSGSVIIVPESHIENSVSSAATVEAPGILGYGN
ncbi:hypothetical protein BS47DRAFT_994224 [Hydnum rufescens UP504]|uniref:Uncharacterized protein n=1 Tax=Hydnum rufescens UP504 TaxID=1448309 RepID=A0A9P6E1S1_9AGAM|nr:hypothetical protein BS47DRAFT_994224 [Hydnum rufescens UP504]